MSTIERQLADARHRLLDLTLRNRLLNHRPSRARSIEITDELAPEVFGRLVLDERAMWFKPAELEPAADDDGGAPVRDEADPGDPSDAEGTDSEPAAGETSAEDPAEAPRADTADAPAVGPADVGPEDFGPEDVEVSPLARAIPAANAVWALPRADVSDAERVEPSREAEPAEVSAGAEGTADPTASVAGVPDDSDADLEDAPPAPRHVDRFLQTTQLPEALQKRLFYIYQQSRSVLDEQGYTVLYLALGFLEWREAKEPDVVRRAPLILIPVDLERKRVGASFKLWWTKEEILTNISLQAKLEDENVALPSLESIDEKAGVDDYFRAVEAAVEAHPEWRVARDICLDFFSFTKFVMYRDLDGASWPDGRAPAGHPLVGRILDPAAAPADAAAHEADAPDVALEPAAAGDAAEASLDAIDPETLFHVMDADPSQMAVIEAVKAGRDLVVEGPPGTGKSQTIANVVAELLAQGKTVLFVSEKMAALEVVKHRLDAVGLGAFCLELHSRKSRKKEVLEELERALAEEGPVAASGTDAIERLVSERQALNDYASAVGDPIRDTGYSPFDLFAVRDESERHFRSGGRPRPAVTIPEADALTRAAFEDARSALERLDAALEAVHPVQTHAWFGTTPGLVLPADQTAIAGMVDEAATATDALDEAARSLADTAGLRRPSTAADVASALESVVLLRDAPAGLTEAHLVGDDWAVDEANRLLDLVDTFHRMRQSLASRMRPDVLDEDVVGLREDFRRHVRSFTRFFAPSYHRARRTIMSFYHVRPPQARIEWMVDLDKVRQTQEARDEVLAEAAAGARVFGAVWRGAESDPEELRRTREWIDRFRRALADGQLTRVAVDGVLTGADDWTGAVTSARDAVVAAAVEFRDGRDALEARLQLDAATRFGRALDDVPFEAWAETLARWRDARRELLRWSTFGEEWAQCAETAAKAVAESLKSDDVRPGDLVPHFNGAIADTLLDAAFRARPALKRFDGAVHERRIEQFRALDLDFIESNRDRLRHRLFLRRPPVGGGASPGSEAGVLLGEFNRKRGHMPIRRLLSRAGGLVQRIKPCFMMSPLSVAQFLDPTSIHFDVVVFDEASQVRPEDALGALLRGKQAVVMGDTRQLPPTTFFDRLVDSHTDDLAPGDAATVAEVESILHQCRRSFESMTLRWHYRSRHESLIAISNAWFYGGELRIYPSPHQRDERLGLYHRYLPDAVYDRGGTGVNRAEAVAVAEAAAEHYRREPEKSLGVGAFNVRQQEAILEEVERVLRREPDLESRFHPPTGEAFFVKNLETIQGDERDVILLSVGFGFDEERRLSRNFGPLNQEGGERRLNVLITRARERCEVFSNFRAVDLRTDDETALGLRALKACVDFAERRESPEDSGALDVAAQPTAFVRTLREALAGRGYRVDLAIGCAGFRVDAGVPDDGQRRGYAVGIETDGPKYHRAAVARDRDRLRATVLHRLGWQLVRAWSVDWFRDREGAVERLIERVERALDAQRVAAEERAPEPAAEASEASARIAPAPEAATDDGGDVDESSDDPAASDAVEAKTAEQSTSVAVPYVECTDLGIPTLGDLTDQSPAQLGRAVERVVTAEGPVHVDEVVRRVRVLWGLKRAGRRVQDAIEQGIEHAAKSDWIVQRSPFLFTRDDSDCAVRRRSVRRLLDLSLIAEEEIAAATRAVLARQFATPTDELAAEVARLLGWGAVSAKVRGGIRECLGRFVDAGWIAEVRVGVLDLVGDSGGG